MLDDQKISLSHAAFDKVLFMRKGLLINSAGSQTYRDSLFFDWEQLHEKGRTSIEREPQR